MGKFRFIYSFLTFFFLSPWQQVRQVVVKYDFKLYVMVGIKYQVIRFKSCRQLIYSVLRFSRLVIVPVKNVALKLMCFIFTYSRVESKTWFSKTELSVSFCAETAIFSTRFVFVCE